MNVTVVVVMDMVMVTTFCAGGEGEGCEDCSDKGATGETVPGVLQYSHPAQVHLLFDPDSYS